jgi:multiple antibiotic resistance protein
MDLNFALAVIVAVFAIVNPIGNVSFYVTLTEGYDRREKQAVVRKVVLVSGGILAIFALVGNYIFEMFSITVPAFRIAGGILLLNIAFSMMQGRHSRTKITAKDRQEALEREAIGIVPLGVPMFAGPGSITTVMIYMAVATSEGVDFELVTLVFVAILITMMLSYIILSYSERIFQRMGRMGALAFSRIMGLILAAMAVQFVMDGVLNFLSQNGLVA